MIARLQNAALLGLALDYALILVAVKEGWLGL